MATLNEMRKAVPTFFNTLAPESRTIPYKGHVIVITTGKNRSVKIYRFVPNKVRSEMAKVPVNVGSVEEAKEVIDGAGAGIAV